MLSSPHYQSSPRHPHSLDRLAVTLQTPNDLTPHLSDDSWPQPFAFSVVLFYFNKKTDDEMGDEQPQDRAPVPAVLATSNSGVGDQRAANRTSIRKHRASVACNHCRFRKVRCIVSGGNSCYNCVLEQVECVLPQRRPRGKPKANPPVVPRLVSPSVADLSTRSLPEPANACSEGWFAPNMPRHGDKSRTPGAMQPEPPPDIIGGGFPFRSWDTTETVAPDRNFDWYGAATQSLTSPMLPDNTVAQSNAPVHSSKTSPDSQDQDLSRLVHPVPSDLAVEDVVYLRRKGALTLPDLGLRNELLQHYVDLVHPCLPLIDLDSFQASLQDPVRHGRISLLLMQAVMFSAAAWADVKLVRQAGFLTRDAMRRAYYLKIKVRIRATMTTPN